MYKFRDDKEKVQYEARYWHACGANISIVASVTKGRDGTPFDWAAYIGGKYQTPSEEEAARWAIDHGDKLQEEDARYFFPELKGVKYRR